RLGALDLERELLGRALRWEAVGEPGWPPRLVETIAQDAHRRPRHERDVGALEGVAPRHAILELERGVPRREPASADHLERGHGATRTALRIEEAVSEMERDPRAVRAEDDLLLEGGRPAPEVLGGLLVAH